MSGPKAPAPSLKSKGTPFARNVDVPETVKVVDPTADLSATINTKKTRAQFRVAEFIRTIRQHGYYLMWRKSALCPCISSTGQVNINCRHCDGSGFYYFDPIEVRGIMTRIERNAKITEKFGPWVEGTSYVTVEPQYRMSFRDQIEMLDSVMTQTEVFKKGDRRAARATLPANMDALRYRIFRPVHMLIYDERDDSIRSLELGYHYEISKDGWVHWLDAGRTSVADGTYVSAIYEYHPLLIVTSHMHASREGVIEEKSPRPEVVALPVQAMVKLDYLMGVATPLASLQSGPVAKLNAQIGCG